MNHVSLQPDKWTRLGIKLFYEFMLNKSGIVIHSSGFEFGFILMDHDGSKLRMWIFTIVMADSKLSHSYKHG